MSSKRNNNTSNLGGINIHRPATKSDFDKIISDNPMVTKNRYLYSTEKLIKLAGNSIVVDVLEAIFRQIMDINGKILGERK